jgi:hypothetical protein
LCAACAQQTCIYDRAIKLHVQNASASVARAGYGYIQGKAMAGARDKSEIVKKFNIEINGTAGAGWIWLGS